MSLTRAAAATTSPANTPSSSTCSTTAGLASRTVMASTPVLLACSLTGTQTRTPSSRSVVTDWPVVNARPAIEAATSSSAAPGVSGNSTSPEKSPR